MFVVSGIFTFLLVLATLLPLWRNPHWIIRGLDFPRLQFATLALLLMTAQLTLLDWSNLGIWSLAAITALCLAWHGWWIIPFTPLWHREVGETGSNDTDRRISILTANVLTPNRNAEALISLVKDHEPDVLVTMESDQWWQDQLDTLEAEMPHTMKCPLDNLYGMHVYSRLPLEETKIRFLVEKDVPSMHALLRLRNGEGVRMHFLHPAPPSPTENPESEERDAELIMVAQAISGSAQPLIVTGDLNDVAWSPTTRLFRKISGVLDPRVGRGMFNTFHADYPFLRWPLDHLFHSGHFTLCSIRRLPSIGSDHFPLFAELSMDLERDANAEGLEADESDRSWARSIVREQEAHHTKVPTPGNEA